MSDSDRPRSDSEILLGVDVDALDTVIEALVVESKLTGKPVDLEMLGTILGVDPDWIEGEYGPGHELAIEVDAEFEAKLLADCELDRLNSRGSTNDKN